MFMSELISAKTDREILILVAERQEVMYKKVEEHEEKIGILNDAKQQQKGASYLWKIIVSLATFIALVLGIKNNLTAPTPQTPDQQRTSQFLNQESQKKFDAPTHSNSH